MSELEPYRPERALQPGYILDGEYVVDRVLGSGGFAITYLAHPRRLPSKRIAIKEYFPKNHAERLANGQVSMDHGSSQSAQICDWGLARFRDEGNNVYEIANERVRHPNIVLVERIFDANNTTYMVMEYVEGDTLEATIHQAIEAGQYLSEEWLRGFLGRMLNALEVIHAARKLHRDIKPSNIIITKAPDGSPQPVLIDFGSARDDLREISSAGDTTNHTIVVSPGYAPIEQERGGTQGAFTDLYGLAATAYHATFLEKPVSSTVRWNAMQVERADGAYEIDLSRDPLRSALNKGKGRFSNAYLAFLDRGLAIEPKRRPASAAQWRTQFGVIEPPPPRPRAKLLSLPWAAGLAVCIVIGAGVGWHYLHSNAPSTKINAALETLALGPTTRSHVNEALSNFSAAAAQEPANQIAQAGARGCSSLLDFIGALQTNDLERAQIAYNVATQALIQAGASEALIDEAAKPLTRLRHEAALLSRLSAAGLDPARLRDLRGNEQELAILYGAGAAQRFSELRKSLEDAASAVAGNEFSRARDLVRNSVVGLSDYPAEFSDRAAATSALRAASASWANSELQALRNRLLGTVDYDQLNESAAGLQIVANQAADDPQADEITALRALVQALSQTRDDDAQT
ncbi:MAG: serine/threonine protein kinase, partial [Gammaproteobacteria bacterium]|nr:serine/threonine protein kinase [Gammaproteobacteria bacterium]